MSFRKGSPRLRWPEKYLSSRMVTMSSSAVYLAFMKHQMGNVLGGTFAFYLVTTAWLTAKRGDRETSFRLGHASDSFAGRNWSLDLWSTTGVWPRKVNRWSSRRYALFHGFRDAAGSRGDIRMLVRGGVFGAKRIVRHLWRMCFGLFVATGSFFLGQQQVFPPGCADRLRCLCPLCCRSRC